MKLPQAPRDLQALIDKANGKFVTMGIPYYDHIEPECDVCRVDLERFSFPYGYTIMTNRKKSTLIEDGRYDIVRKGFYGDYLLWIDADQVFPPDTLMRLVAHDKPIVGTLVSTKEPPHMVVTGIGDQEYGYMSILDWPENSLIEVDVTGFGCCLIKREVLEAFPEGNPFERIKIPAFDSKMGEDWSFCVRAKEMGFPIHVDTSIPVGHKGQYIYTIGDYMLWKEHCIKNQKNMKYYKEALNPKMVSRIEPHPKMKNVLTLPENGNVVKPKNRLMLMGES